MTQLPLKEKILKLASRGFFIKFFFFVFVIIKLNEGKLIFLINIKYYLNGKVVAVCIVYDNTWEFLMTFWWHIWCLLATKNSFSSWRLFPSGATLWFVIGRFSPPYFLSLPLKICADHSKFHSCPLSYWYFNLNFYSFDFDFFVIGLFFKKIICFQFYLSIPIYDIYLFFNLILIILIFWVFLLNRFFFSISPFNKKFIVFL
jgi:hypothetical protein